MFANKYNKFTAGYNYTFPEVPVYIKPAELVKEFGISKVYPIYGLYINDKGNYGPQAVAATDGNMIVNLPQHLTALVEEMRHDDELTAAINKGEFGFQVREYKRKGDPRTYYSIEWVDIKPF